MKKQRPCRLVVEIQGLVHLTNGTWNLTEHPETKLHPLFTGNPTSPPESLQAYRIQHLITTAWCALHKNTPLPCTENSGGEVRDLPRATDKVSIIRRIRTRIVLALKPTFVPLHHTSLQNITWQNPYLLKGEYIFFAGVGNTSLFLAVNINFTSSVSEDHYECLLGLSLTLKEDPQKAVLTQSLL